MFPIKLTHNHSVNPEAVAYTEFFPKGRLGDNPLFVVVFDSNELAPIQLSGAEAEDARRNWNAALGKTTSSGSSITSHE